MSDKISQEIVKELDYAVSSKDTILAILFLDICKLAIVCEYDRDYSVVVISAIGHQSFKLKKGIIVECIEEAMEVTLDYRAKLFELIHYGGNDDE